MEQDSIIRFENVKFSYDRTEDEKTISVDVLKNITAGFKKGSFTAVLGRNGSGKSTLAKHTNAILIPKEGKVWAAGIDTSDESRIYDIRQHVGMVFQNPDNQIVAAVVEEDVAFGLENLGIDPDEMRKRVDEALKAVGMYEYRLHSPGMLSGGQKQRTAIAGIIAMRPECLILDEPTAMLDPAGRRDVMEIIKMLNSEFGITIILITHYMEEAVQADRVVVMDDGKIILDGEPHEVFSNVGILKNVGLDVPQVTELMFELSKEGFNTGKNIITEEECVEALMKLLKED